LAVVLIWNRRIVIKPGLRSDPF